MVGTRALGRRRGVAGLLAMALVASLLAVAPVAPASAAAGSVDQKLSPDGPCDAATYKAFVSGPVAGGTITARQSFMPSTRLTGVVLCMTVTEIGYTLPVRILTGPLGGPNSIVATGLATPTTTGTGYVSVDLVEPLLTTPGVAYVIEAEVNQHVAVRGTCAFTYGTCPAADADAYPAGSALIPGAAPEDQSIADLAFRTFDDPLPGLFMTPGSFAAATTANRVTETFDAFAPGTLITNQVPGVVFSTPGEPLYAYEQAAGENGLFGGFQGLAGPQVFRAAFAQPTSAVGFAIDAQDPTRGPATVRFTRTDGSIQSLSLHDNDNNENTPYYVGYESISRKITNVEIISPPEIGGGGEEILVDDFTFARYVPSDITFSRNEEVWTVDASGTNPTSIVATAFNDSDASWSPDGSKIAFVSTRAGEQDIWIADADGTDARNVTASVDGFSADPDWSPDGTRIAFANIDGIRPSQYDVHTINIDGSDVRNLTAALGAGGNEGFPTWSPDGSKLAFNRDPANSGNNEIFTANASDGSGAVAITDDPAQAWHANWSDAGIVFISTRSGNGDVYRMAPDGSGLTQVTATPSTEDFPAWSPDGAQVVFSRDGGLVVRTLASAAELQLTPAGSGDGGPDWSAAAADDATELSLTVDKNTAKVGAATVPLNQIPADALGRVVSGVQASPVGSIPVGSIPVGSIPVGSIPVGSIDLAASPVGSIPVGSIPVGSIPVGSIGLDGVLASSLGIDLAAIVVGSQLEGLPRQTLTLRQILDDPVAGPRFRALSLAASGLGDSIFGDASVAALLLGGLPLSQLAVPAGTPADTTWCALFALADPGFSCTAAGIDPARHGLLGSQLASAPVGSIPVGSIPVGSIPVGSIPVGSIPVGSIDLATSPVGSIPVGSIAVENSPVGSIPVGSIPVGSIPVGSIPVGSIPVGSIDLATSPVGSIPVGSIDLATSPVGSIPVGSIPVGSIPVGSIPVGSIPVGSIDLATSPVGSIPVGSIPVGSIARVLTCGNNCDQSTLDLTLAEAHARGLVLTGVTLADLGSAAAQITLAQLGASVLNQSGITLASLTGALAGIELDDLGRAVLNRVLLWWIGSGVLDQHGISLASLTGALAGVDIGDLAGADFGAITLYQLILDLLITSDFPWETLPIDGMQDFAGVPGNELTYTAAATVDCPVGAAAAATVELPDGFRYRPESAAVTLSGVATGGPQEPMRDGAGSLRWTVDCTGGPAPLVVTFQARPGFNVGSFASNLEVRAGASRSQLDGQAPVLVTEHGEPDSAAAPRTVAADTLVVGHLASGRDVDILRIPAPASGSRVKAFLSHIAEGADFDLTLGTTGTDPLQSSPVGSIPVGSIPIEDVGARLGGDASHAPETLQDIPVGSIPVGSISANRDNADEAAQLLITEGDDDVLIQVSGYNGSSSPSAYVLRLKVTGPVVLPPCPARTGVDATDDAARTQPAPLSSTKSLFLVARGRMADLHGEQATATMMSDLATLAGRTEVGGQIVPLEGDADVRAAFANWDATPCSIDRANDLVGEIKDVIARYRSAAGANLTNVVLVGSDEALPFARIPDLVTLSNEQDMAAELSFTLVDGKANALYAAAARGFILSDDAYTAFSDVPWLGRSLSLPQIPVARLVETPGEVSGQIAQYLANGGIVDPTTAQATVLPKTLTTGYDFLADGATAVAESLRKVVGEDSQNVTLINDTWRKDDLTGVFTGASPVPVIASVNGHYDQWRLQPAGPAPGGRFTQTDLLGTNEIPDGKLPGRVLFTMGCHAGLNVADRLATAGAAPALDWAQKNAQQRAAVYLANTGYGYGDTVASALSERLMALFAEELVDGRTTVGEKYVRAKHNYFETMGTYGVFDEKALVEATLYGLPFWRVTSAEPAAAAPAAPTVTNDPATGLATASVSITPLAGPTPEVTQRSDATRGTWFAGPRGAVSFAPYRPLQPLITRDVTSTAGPAKGVWVKRLTTDDSTVVSDFARALPTVDLSSNEPEVDLEGDIYPANFVSLATSRPMGKNHQRLVLIAGQSRSTVGGGRGGVQRLVTDFAVDVAYSTSTDTAAPRISEVGAVFRPDNVGAGGTAEFFLEVEPEVGGTPILRAAVLYKDADSNGVWELVTLTRIAGTDRWTASRSVASKDLEISGQVQKASGAVGYSTNKGRFFTSVVADAVAPDITIQSPVAGATFPLGDAATAIYGCVDPAGVASCIGPVPSGVTIDTATPGAHDFTVSASDAGGNTGSRTVTYFVDGSYEFGGFRPPLLAKPIVNSVKAGSTVPVKWQLKDERGRFVRSLAAVTRIEVRPTTSGPALLNVLNLPGGGIAGLTYDTAGEQYHYNYKTTKGTTGTVELTIYFADGSSGSVLLSFRS